VRGRRAEIVADGDLTTVPPAPIGLPCEMRGEWQVITADLFERKLLTASMLGTVDAFLTARWVVDGCRKAIAQDGFTTKTKEGHPKPHPLFGVLNKSLEQIARLAAELALTPAARSRKALQAPASDGGGNELASRFDV
jgi:P27 family predicted phage terminase small subunit